MAPSKPKRERVWARVKSLTPQEKADIAAACERLVAEVLKPKFLPEIRPSQFNYPIDIFGKRRGSSYSFIVRHRLGFPDNARRGIQFRLRAPGSCAAGAWNPVRHHVDEAYGAMVASLSVPSRLKKPWTSSAPMACCGRPYESRKGEIYETAPSQNRCQFSTAS